MTAYFDDLVAAARQTVDDFITSKVSGATETLQTQLTTVTADLLTAEQNLQEADAELGDLHNDVADKANQIATLTVANATLTTQRDQAVAAKVALQAQLQSAQAQVLQLQTQVTQLQARIAELEAELPEQPRPLLFGLSATANSAKGTTSDLAEFQRLQTATGKKLARRTFETLVGTKATPTWAQCSANNDIANGVTASVVSWKVDYTKIASVDATVLASQENGWKNLVQSIPTGHPVYLTIHHEMDPEVDPATYIRAFQNFATWVKRYRGDRDITIFWCPTGWAFYEGNGDPTRVAARWYPGDEYVELVATDAYNRSTTKYYALDHPITGASQAYAFAKAHGKRFGIAEFGCYSNAANRQADFVAAAKTWLASLDGPTCEFALWFSSAIGASEDAKGFGIDLVPATFAAWKAAV